MPWVPLRTTSPSKAICRNLPSTDCLPRWPAEVETWPCPVLLALLVPLLRHLLVRLYQFHWLKTGICLVPVPFQAHCLSYHWLSSTYPLLFTTGHHAKSYQVFPARATLCCLCVYESRASDCPRYTDNLTDLISRVTHANKGLEHVSPT
jgi:hypothetical protein